MFRDAEEYEARAGECERLAFATCDLVLRDQILSLSRIYLDYAFHLRGRADQPAEDWRQAVNQ